MQYYVNFEGKSKGPFNMAQLQKTIWKSYVWSDNEMGRRRMDGQQIS